MQDTRSMLEAFEHGESSPRLTNRWNVSLATYSKWKEKYTENSEEYEFAAPSLKELKSFGSEMKQLKRDHPVLADIATLSKQNLMDKYVSSKFPHTMCSTVVDHILQFVAFDPGAQLW